MSDFGVNHDTPNLFDDIEHQQGLCGEDFTDLTFFRYEPRRSPKCALVVDGVTVDLGAPRRLPSPLALFDDTPMVQPPGQALNAFMDAILERREFCVVPKRRVPR